MRRLLVAFLVFFSLVLPGVAAGLAEEERAALAERIDSFGDAVRNRNTDAVLGALPPKMLESVAAQAGVTVEALVEASQAEIDRVMAEIELISSVMALDEAEFAILPDGTPYALIPTETVLALGKNGGRVRSRTTTVALLEDGTWYLMRVEYDQQVSILRQIYPGFADVTFPQGQVEMVDE